MSQPTPDSDVSSILEVRNLVKHFTPGFKIGKKGPPVKAVNGVSFKIPPGICFGLLGPNGAGKTTTLEMIEGIHSPTSGEILYKGLAKNPLFRKECGIQFQHTAVPDFLRVGEAISLFAGFYEKHLPVETVTDWCGITDLIDRDVHKLSGGQQQRVLLAMALVHDPEVVFLDEPTTGLDPQARRNFWELIKSIKAKGKTIVLTTHYMEEAYILCDRIAIMDQGKILVDGSPQTLLRSIYDGVALQLPKLDVPEAVSTGLAMHLNGDDWELETRDVNETVDRLLKAGVSLKGLRIRSHTLDDLFLHLTGKGLRE